MHRTNKLVFGSHALVSTLGTSSILYPNRRLVRVTASLLTCPWTGNLGVQHSRQRKLLNPVFSVNHMRNMIPLFYNVTYRVSSVDSPEKGCI